MPETPSGTRSETDNLLQVPISLLEHHAYCPRQAALIALEDAYAEDASTVRGTLCHQRAHEPGHETRDGVRTYRALPVWNDQIGLIGVCDVVEIHPDNLVLPIEHKSGRYKSGGPGDVQLAGQAICLEQMLGVTITEGAIFSAADKRRHHVAIDQPLRERVHFTAGAVRAMLETSAMPPPVNDRRCPRCSMNSTCMPALLADQRAYHSALQTLFDTPDQE